MANKVHADDLEYILEKSEEPPMELTMSSMGLARDLQALDICIATRSWVDAATKLISKYIKSNYLGV